MPISVTTAGRVTVKTDDGTEYGKPGPWLDLIHEANRLRPASFGPPSFTGIRDGADHYVEEYADADVQIRGGDESHPEDQVVTIVSKTPQGASDIRAAAVNLGLQWTESGENDEQAGAPTTMTVRRGENGETYTRV